MKTLEELKGMTQEDLVRLIQELQESNKSLSDLNSYYNDAIKEINKKYEYIVNAHKAVVNIL